MGTKKPPTPSNLARMLLDLVSDDREAAVAAARALDTDDSDALRVSVQDVLRRPEFVGRSGGPSLQRWRARR
ncbi:MAG: hypothetical protein H6818_08830 [Phycisphaerales bacterium]|nr:hypothetical protein [Phycisphaerales bacterium]MCB9862675.1 hypothetical protein [Phycisphaerales bacterium]